MFSHMLSGTVCLAPGDYVALTTVMGCWEGAVAFALSTGKQVGFGQAESRGKSTSESQVIPTVRVRVLSALWLGGTEHIPEERGNQPGLQGKCL